MNIRFARPEDAQKLENFLVFNNGEGARKLAQQYIQCCFSNDYRKPFFVVVEMNDDIVGAAAFSQEIFTTGLWGISWVSVHEDHRHQGLGEKLIRKCLDEITANADGKVNVMLGTYPDKTGLYDKTGFVKLGKSHCGGWFMTTVVGETKKETK